LPLTKRQKAELSTRRYRSKDAEVSFNLFHVSAAANFKGLTIKQWWNPVEW